MHVDKTEEEQTEESMALVRYCNTSYYKEGNKTDTTIFLPSFQKQNISSCHPHQPCQAGSAYQ